MSSDLRCDAHPEAPAIAACSACGRWCCVDCRVVSPEGLAQCPECSVVQAPPHVPDPPPAVREPDPPPPGSGFDRVAEADLGASFLDPPADLSPLPWESSEGGDAGALRRTIWAGLTRPVQYPARIDWVAGDLYTPLVFALICATIGHVASVLQLAFSSETVVLPGAPGLAALNEVPALALGLLTLPAFPLLFTGLLFGAAFLSHLVLDLAGQTQRPFEATFRVLAYAHVGKVLLVVPVLGANVQVFYMVFLVLTGLRVAHGAGLGISLLALVPVVAAELFLG